MKTVALSAAVALSLVAPAPAQTGAQSSSITADLNRAPATAQAPAANPTPPPRAAGPSTATSQNPVPTPAPAVTGPTGARLQPSTVPPPASRPPRPTQAAPSAEAATPPPPVTPAPEPIRPMTAAQIAALPFTLTLPTGTQLVEGRSSDSFDLYTVRRGSGPALVTIYAGERSDYPIYGGREVTAGGRTSVVVNEGQGDHAMEHIFLRGTAPREVHIWVGSVDDADRALAEAIAQSVDVR